MIKKENIEELEMGYTLSEDVGAYLKSSYHELEWGELLQGRGLDDKQVIGLGADVKLIDNTHVELTFRDMLIEDCESVMYESTEPVVLELGKTEKEQRDILTECYDNYLEIAGIVCELEWVDEEDYPYVGEYFEDIREYGIRMHICNYYEFVYWMDDMLCRALEVLKNTVEFYQSKESA